MSDLQQLLFDNRIYAADLVLPDLLAACVTAFDATLASACAALAAWDRKAKLDSRGAVLFREFWNSAVLLPDKWARPFDPADPLHTPRRIAPAALPVMLASLKSAAQKLQALGIPLDGRLGDFQGETRDGKRVPIHGGIGNVDGSYNSIHMVGALEASGYNGVAWGSSHIQLVGFDAKGPVARGLLVYGQSSDPQSPFYSDQLPLYFASELAPLPFWPEAIAADPSRRMTSLRER